MNQVGSRVAKVWHAETGPLICLLTVAGLLLIFCFIADEVLEGSTASFDRSVIMVFRSATDPSVLMGPVWMPEMVRDITALGSVTVLGIVLFVVVGYLILANLRAAAALMLVAVLGGMALNSLLKFSFARPRPDFIIPAAKVFTASFPSGHAVLSAITYLTIAALLARTTESRCLRIYFVTVGIALALLVGVSRVYLGVHYPSDVLAGWCVGSAWALGCWAIMSRLQHGGKIELPRSPIASH